MRCAIEIHHGIDDVISFVEDLSTIQSISIQRKAGNEGSWREIKKVVVSSENNLIFSFIDYTTRSHQEYEYRNVITTDADYIGVTNRIISRFFGIVIANKSKAYVSLINPEYTCQREFNTAYIKPYNSQYPHVIQNGIANSSKGTVKGSFNPIGDDCLIQMEYADFTDEFIDFLSDGTSKVLKTYDGHAWYVQIDTPVTLETGEIEGLSKINFSWTEIGRMPVNLNHSIAG